MKRLIISALLVFIAIALGYLAYSQLVFAGQPAINLPFKVAIDFAAVPTPTPEPQPAKLSIVDPGSLWVVVNKNHSIPFAYQPELVVPHIRLQQSAQSESMHISIHAAPDLERMFAVMQSVGLQPVLLSGFRSATTQKQLYVGYVAVYGQTEADRFSARPGTSEHQTGLAIDIGRTSNTCALDACFATTPEGAWLAAHAHEYGFIIRYPGGREAVTGYMYEPWHVRYVGPQLAAELFASGLTLEEHFKL